MQLIKGKTHLENKKAGDFTSACPIPNPFVGLLKLFDGFLCIFCTLGMRYQEVVLLLDCMSIS